MLMLDLFAFLIQQGQTPLHLAAENDHSDVVKLFLKHRPELVTMASTVCIIHVYSIHKRIILTKCISISQCYHIFGLWSFTTLILFTGVLLCALYFFNNMY